MNQSEAGSKEVNEGSNHSPLFPLSTIMERISPLIKTPAAILGESTESDSRKLNFVVGVPNHISGPLHNFDVEMAMEGPGNGRVVTDTINISYSLVSDLIDQTTHTWKEDVVRMLFSADQAMPILCIPIPVNHQPDKLILREDRSGLYSVRSGYRYLINKSIEQEAIISQQYAEGVKKFYDRLWSLSIPPKLNIFSGDVLTTIFLPMPTFI
ncbi:hypothetical protein V6N12_042122 [Hibiscus sabdariffa]|uniref:Uncharacterized protein n=1 Tax=Hibiscus sabdariffa TaxID=183260 RepID=A0ABR2EDV3_9ROSI